MGEDDGDGGKGATESQADRFGAQAALVHDDIDTVGDLILHKGVVHCDVLKAFLILLR